MYGYSFASKYRGSMYGVGIVRHAVLDWVIACQVPHAGLGAVVELNPADMANAFGGVSKEDVQNAIQFHCEPDPESRSKLEDGKRLVPLGEFLYRVVNWQKYRNIRNEFERREANRLAVAQCRQRKQEQSAGLPVSIPAKRPGRRKKSKLDPKHPDYLRNLGRSISQIPECAPGEDAHDFTPLIKG